MAAQKGKDLLLKVDSNGAGSFTYTLGDGNGGQLHDGCGAQIPSHRFHR